MSETSEIVVPLIEYLEGIGLFVAFRNNVGGRGRLRWGVGGEGAPDILGWHIPTGRVFGVECKVKGGKLSPAQERWRNLALTSNCVYLICNGNEQIGPTVRDLLKTVAVPI